MTKCVLPDLRYFSFRSLFVRPLNEYPSSRSFLTNCFCEITGGNAVRLDRHVEGKIAAIPLGGKIARQAPAVLFQEILDFIGLSQVGEHLVNRFGHALKQFRIACGLQGQFERLTDGHPKPGLGILAILPRHTGLDADAFGALGEAISHRWELVGKTVSRDKNSNKNDDKHWAGFSGSRLASLSSPNAAVAPAQISKCSTKPEIEAFLKRAGFAEVRVDGRLDFWVYGWGVMPKA